VTSGIDWFNVDGQMAFGDTVIRLPQILKRIEPGNLVRLENGQFGMLPEGWMEQYGRLLQLGEQTDGPLRFRRAQGFLLDAMLAERERVTFDQKFVEFQQRVQQFAGIREVSVPATFQGTLRGYQCEGHNWLHFLREFGLGGCLADDMGLGKTVQVLALLETRRWERIQSKQPHRPTLLVVPKSLVFNWMAEAERFTPQLKFLNYSGQNRKTLTDQIASADVVLTTYATMRIDIGMLKDIEFDYAILDEAQAIKNAQALTAKAALLVRADHRLALSGTPIENRLSDLWSIFEFLNPGMLGICSVFTELGRGEATQDTLQRLGQALKPMLLRRTKDQVLKDLPAKNEQTIVCELESKQRKLYDEVLKYYRQSLTARINREGLNKSKIHVLEALTRLRQIACHPALIDPAHRRVKSAKLEALYENLESVIGEGHKALVFSQFTSLLAIVRQELDKRQFTYEYLDGQTSNRKRCVERFNNDPSVPIFLLSLKAGGHGLNLTAADYVFILDPWWNPAVEAQAIDRAHRIGQTKPVFAYRMIAKDTVEEKIVALQQSKRELAEAIVRADTSVIKNLSMDDLQLLLT
ncbi:MAG TPA: DEAD/DEAH box helicase, partial [Pirellulaceae bacterium]|nr:DEAD/DEAH box helicase [Pirellulaceae bacterium]